MRPDSTRVISPRPASAALPAPADLAAARASAATVSVSAEVTGYIVDLCRATRSSAALQLGVSPRGGTASAGNQPGLGLAVRP